MSLAQGLDALNAHTVTSADPSTRSAEISLSSMLGRFLQSRYPAASYETSEWTVKYDSSVRTGIIDLSIRMELGPGEP